VSAAAPPRSESRWRRALGEFGGAFGDLGTLLPLTLGAITVAGLAPAGILFGFGITLVGTGLFYGLPMPVQPMKAIAAVILTGDLDAGEVVAAGVLTGAILLVLGATGAMGRIAKLIPQSVTAGLQLGLGLSMGLLGLKLAIEAPWLGAAALMLLVCLMRLPRWPAAPTMLVAIVLAGWITGIVEAPPAPAFAPALPPLIVPSLADAWQSLWGAVVPQMPLTLTNAVIVTAALARDLFPNTPRVSERNLCLSTGLANLALAPFGAMPMCHGGRAGCRRSTASAPAPGRRRPCSAACCSCWHSASPAGSATSSPSCRPRRWVPCCWSPAPISPSPSACSTRAWTAGRRSGSPRRAPCLSIQRWGWSAGGPSSSVAASLPLLSAVPGQDGDRLTLGTRTRG
jgi:hypothetical protein